MIYYFDNIRHLVCVPYSIENLHKMADELGIKKCWFDKDHYDIPKRRIKEISDKAILIRPRYHRIPKVLPINWMLIESAIPYLREKN